MGQILDRRGRCKSRETFIRLSYTDISAQAYVKFKRGTRQNYGVKSVRSPTTSPRTEIPGDGDVTIICGGCLCDVV